MKNAKISKRGWIERVGAIMLCATMLVTGTITASAQENIQPTNVPSGVQDTNSKSNFLPLDQYLKKCWEEKETAIDLTAYNITYEELNKVIFDIHYEEPEYYWTIRNNSFDEDKTTGKLKTYYPCYVGETGSPFDRSEEPEREWKIVAELTKNCITDVEKALVVHDHLVRTIQYSASLGAFVAHDIEGGILEKKCVCEGYALAYKYYMNRLNIPCKVVSGVSRNQPHAWNQIEINGKWYLVDATWDDGSCALDEKSHPVKHTYFLKSEYEFEDHT